VTHAVACHDCGRTAYPPIETEGAGGATEIAALRLALEHVKETGHRDVHVIAGCYYVGPGARPTGFDEGITLAQTVTPPRSKLVADLEFAIDTLRSQADTLERWGEDTSDDAALRVRTLARHLRERADLLERKQREREHRARNHPADPSSHR